VPRYTLKTAIIRLVAISLIVLATACSALPFGDSDVTATPIATPTAAVASPASAAGGALAEADDLLAEAPGEPNERAPGIFGNVPLPEPSMALPTIDPLEVADDITVGGSAVVYPITRQLYRRFVREGYGGIMKIERVGTGEGFRLLCAVGTADLVNAGRAVTPNEVELCSSINRVPLPFAIGQAALAVYVHPDNNFVETISTAQLSAILTATRWSEVDPTWPAEPIAHLFPRADADEFATMVRLVMNGDRDALLDAPNVTIFDTNEELIQAFTDNPYAVGFASHALLLQDNSAYLRAVPLDGQLPNARTVRDGSYPLVFPLYLYTDPGILRDKPQVAAFVNFYLNHINEEIRRIGYFAADAAALDAARLQLLTVLGEE
jgi:ABC-type phosphate transport system substrate-binding protein